MEGGGGPGGGANDMGEERDEGSRLGLRDGQQQYIQVRR
jgi:hypothetical protein